MILQWPLCIPEVHHQLPVFGISALKGRVLKHCTESMLWDLGRLYKRVCVAHSSVLLPFKLSFVQGYKSSFNITLKFIAVLFKPEALIYIAVWDRIIFYLLPVQHICGFSNLLCTVWPAFFPPSAGFKLSLEQKEEGNLRAFSLCLGIFLEENGESLQGLCILWCGARALYWWSAAVAALLFRKYFGTALMQENSEAAS